MKILSDKRRGNLHGLIVEYLNLNDAYKYLYKLRARGFCTDRFPFKIDGSYIVCAWEFLKSSEYTAEAKTGD